MKLPGPTVTAMRVERGERQVGRLHHAVDHRHQRFGVTARHRLRFVRAQRTGLGVEDGHRAGLERSVDGEDQHGTIIAPWRADIRPAPAIHSVIGEVRSVRTHCVICCTSTTSGTKCLSRFWMPCFSVAVEEGQPAQEPFMSR